MAQQEVSTPSKEFLTRLVSAAVLIPPVVAAIYFGSPYFEVFVGIGAVILIGELFIVTGKRLRWTLAGAVYVMFASYALISLRAENLFGLETVIWLFVLVWSADTGAYLVGRCIGGPKFAPRLSPKKTWSGFAGAVLFAGIAGGIAGYILEKDAILPISLYSGFLGGLSQYGDLLESWIKRRFDKKDMSALIPGHGGLFDRADGLVAAAIGAWITDLVTTESLLKWL